MKSHPVLAVALMAAALPLSPVALAAPVSFLTGAVAQVDANPHGDNNFLVDRQIGQRNQSTASSSFSKTGGGVASSARALGDLPSGTVRAATALTMTNQSDGFVAMATGFIGDGYRHFSGTDPFTWTSGTTARFDLQLTGSASLGGNVRDLFNAGLVFLMIYPRNTLEDQSVPFCGAFQSYFWAIGPSSDRQTPCGGGFQGSVDGTVNQTFSLPFSHDGDFDWVFGIRVGGAVSANPSTTVTWVNDFFSTARLFYTPPAGVTSIESGSGSVLASGPAGSVPLPGSMALVGLALAALALTRRRRESA